jgi:hypothetical protein
MRNSFTNRFRRAARNTLLLALCPAAWCTTYYIDSTNGLDSNSGTAPAAAWQTLAMIRQASLNPGDFVLLKRGGVWHDRLRITASGTQGAPITFGAYGSGNRPAIDGQGITIPAQSGLVSLSNQSWVTIEGLEVRYSARDGISPYQTNNLVIRDCVVHDNQFNGILSYSGNSLVITNSEFYANSLDTTTSYDGIAIDGSGPAQSNFVISNSRIHDNVGGEGWNGANGIYLGHTGTNIPTLQNITITGNEIYHNGNPDQNQAGRGLSGSFNGDVTVTKNNIHHNASAGLYLGDTGLVITINITENIFVDNALRQFGGLTDGSALATQNFIFVDDPSITAMGVEIGGNGPWVLLNNVFTYTTPTNDIYRGFIRVNNPAQDGLLQSDYNVFYSAGPNRWKMSDGTPLSFSLWRASGFDAHSANPK